MRIVLTIVLGLTLSVFFPGAQAQAQKSSDGARLTPVKVGVVDASSDAGFFIADKKGYFRDEGLAVSFVSFNSAAKMVVPLGAGHLDVGGGASSAGLYNAIARGISIKIVADKGSMPAGYGYLQLLVRKDLVDSGRYKGLKDLKGMKVVGSGVGTASTSTLNEILKKVGGRASDVERVYMAFPQQVMALQNKAVDAAMITEPSATKVLQSGAVVKVIGGDEAYPNQQLAVVLYSGAFTREKPETARRFMRAYLRAVRDYNDALKDGKLAGANAPEVISILTEYTNIKDPELYKAITPNGCNPNGKVDEASLNNDLQFFKDERLIEGEVSLRQAVDNAFVEAALKDLGPYVPRNR